MTAFRLSYLSTVLWTENPPQHSQRTVGHVVWHVFLLLELISHMITHFEEERVMRQPREQQAVLLNIHIFCLSSLKGIPLSS